MQNNVFAMKDKFEKLIEKTGASVKRMFSNDWAKLVIIFSLALLLRSYDLGGESFVADEFLDVNSAYGYRQTGIWQAWNFNLGEVEKQDVYAARDERAWLYKLQVAELLRFMPLNETNARIPSVVWGLISVWAVYWSASYFSKNRTVAMLAAFLFAVSVTGIIYDRKIRMYAMFYPVYLGLATAVFAFLENKKGESKNFLIRLFRSFDFKWLLPALILALAGFMIHDLTFMVGPTLALYFLVLMLSDWKSGDSSGALRYAAFLAFGTLSGLFIYRWRPDYFGILGWGQDNYEYVGKIFNDYSYAGLALLFVFFGSGYLVRQGRVKQAVWLNAAWLAPLLIDIFLGKRVQGLQYIFFAQAFVLILVAVGIYALADHLRRNLKQGGEKWYWSGIFLALLLIPNYAYFWSGNNTYARNYNEVANYKRVLGTVKKNLQPGDVLITRNFRNYYLSGAKVRIYDFGGERATKDLDAADIRKMMSENPSGWVVLFDNDDDYLTGEANDLLQRELVRYKHPQIVGNPKIYRWGNINK